VRCQFFGPRGSIAFSELAEPILFVGDETSLAAARALRDARRSTCVFEVADEPATRHVLAELGLEATLVQRRIDDAHLGTLADAIASAGAGTLVATGRAQTIQALRRRGLRPAKTKAYWSVGKAGLD
jgi:NADPH-dependent ferric siderophore reductase